ncbi:hypothetical protein Zmor_009646 [Zophobas morio]|uniref:Uncharacterized protein n=1 Tax=Zophobas morio TaxID=2755281 RepID=A0AA38IJF2_9CUCU|nr:hypothetical protein Zmor_009646 [Zophobas morio]
MDIGLIHLWSNATRSSPSTPIDVWRFGRGPTTRRVIKLRNWNLPIWGGEEGDRLVFNFDEVEVKRLLNLTEDGQLTACSTGKWILGHRCAFKTAFLT